MNFNPAVSDKVKAVREDVPRWKLHNALSSALYTAMRQPGPSLAGGRAGIHEAAQTFALGDALGRENLADPNCGEAP